MPKPTFFNLSHDKRKHIFEHALQEFAAHPYEGASLSEIVSNAKIAKGSMYQYFVDKKDLYKYVVHQVYRHKRDYMQSVWSKKDTLDFFALVTLYYQQSWHYAREFPFHHKVTANFWDSRDEAVRSEIIHEKEVRILEFEEMLEHGCELGLIDPATDKSAAWFIYHAVGRALIDNFLELDISSTHETFIDSVFATLERGLRFRKE